MSLSHPTSGRGGRIDIKKRIANKI